MVALPTSRARAAALGTALLSATLPIAGCVCDGSKPTDAPARPRELAYYDFVREPDGAHVQLWPPDDKAPKRKKRDLLTRQSGTLLVAQVDGKDPYFVWDFETQARAAALSVELESDSGGRLQLFWADEDCKIYQERCSATYEIGTGLSRVDFVLDPGRPLNGVRLDLPEVNGAKIEVHHVRLYQRPRLTSGFRGRDGHTETRPTSGGLRLSSKSPDPWLTFSTPWLVAEQVESVEVELSGPEGSVPELHWSGEPCSHFEPRCRVVFTPVAGKPNAHAARLEGVADWRGRIGQLRLDPGEPPGEYLLRSVVLVRRSEKRD